MQCRARNPLLLNSHTTASNETPHRPPPPRRLGSGLASHAPLAAQSNTDPPPFLRTGPNLTQPPAACPDFVKTRWMDRDGDGWDDLWCYISRITPDARNPDKVTGYQGRDTDGDTVSDYDEMLRWRDPHVKGPPLGWPFLTVQEILEAQRATEALRRQNEARMAQRRAELKKTRAVRVGTVGHRGGLTLGQAHRAGVMQLREKHLRERTGKLQRLHQAKVKYQAMRTPDGKTLEEAYGLLFHDEENGKPLLAELHNVASAQMIQVDKLNAAPELGGLGLGLTGAGVLFGHFDGAPPLETHPEFNEGSVARLDFKDTDTSGDLKSAQHATHTAGTLASAGDDDANSMGMTKAGEINSWKLDDDIGKMTDAFTNRIPDTEILDISDDFLLSSHSYGLPSGWQKPVTPGGIWSWRGNQWHTDTPDKTGKDGYFGGYSTIPASYDWFIETLVYPLMVFSAGNDRLESPPLPIEIFFDPILGDVSVPDPSQPSGWSLYPPPPPDGGLLGWDCISTNGSAKNVLTVGAVMQDGANIVPAEFSAAGPTDDGRIKPDVVAKGVDLYSTSKTSAGAPHYQTLTGTSMAAPSACGALGLIVELYREVYGGGAKLWASTLKALAIHCADDIHNPGPDYRTGWGLLNAKRMAEVLLADGAAGFHAFIKEVLLHDECEFKIRAIGPGTPVRVTICWTDSPPAAYLPTSGTNNPAPRLTKDIDLRVYPAAGSPHLPWVLSRLNPDGNATKGDNSVDNVEVVDFVPAAAGEEFTVRLNFSSEASGWSPFGENRPVSVIVSGAEAQEPPPFRITSTTLVSAAEQLYAIEWPTVVGQYFRFETSTDLINWTVAEGEDGPTGDVCATHEVSSFELKASANEPRRFWRVRRIEPWDLAEPYIYVE